MINLNEKLQVRDITFDNIRFFSILYIVFILHFSQYTKHHDWYLSNFAETITGIALTCFTFISGYFAYCSYEKRNRNALQFYRDRLIRIYPLFVISAISLLSIGTIQNRTDFLFTCLGYAGCLLGHSPTTLWYVCMLFIFYAITPYVLNKKHIVEKFLSGILIFIILTTIVFIAHGDARVSIYYPSYLIGLLTVPCLKFYTNKNFDMCRLNFSVKLLTTLLVLLCCLVFLYNIAFLKVGRIKLILNESIYLLALLFIVILSKAFACTFQTKSNTFITVASYSSFCMYLFHRLIFYIYQQYLHAGGGYQ